LLRGTQNLLCTTGGLHPPSWPNDSRAAWRTSIGGRETLVQDWYVLSTPLAIPKKAALALSLFTPDSPLLPPSSASSPSSTTPSIRTRTRSTPDPLPHRISFLSCASFPLLFPSVAAKGFGAPSLGLGWRGVNELVLRGLRRLAADDAATAAAAAAAAGSSEGKEDAGASARGRRYVRGEGGMVVLLDFWESTAGGSGRGRDARRERGLVQQVVQMNFAA
ncbi:hypothetical protein JCM9279_005491, partial [Rhodotorula babjevae]